MPNLRRFVSQARQIDSGIGQALADIADWQDAVETKLGRLQTSLLDDPSQADAAQLPSPATFVVLGLDGKFVVLISNPQSVLPASVLQMQFMVEAGINTQAAAIVHNLQSASDTNFDNNSGVTDYGISPQLSYSIQNANVTLFWRLRSSYDGNTWNDWQLLTSPSTCGPVAVMSGFERSTSFSPNSSTNSSNNATVDSIDAGASDTIRAYGLGGVGSSFTRFDGQSGQTIVRAATILGAAYDSDFTVMYDPPASQVPSGTDTFNAYPNLTQYVSVLPDRFYFVGQLHTVKAGGTGGTSGGGGNSGGGRGGGSTGRPLPV